MAGRPSLFTQEIATEICHRLASGESLRKVCEDEHLPSFATVTAWNIDNYEGFSAQYTRARAMQAELLADEILTIADDGRNDTYTEEVNGKTFTRTDHDVINRSRLRVDTRKWYLSKVLPKIYGDKLDLNHAGKDGGPLVFEVKRVDKE